jgi:hypothetical protein
VNDEVVTFSIFRDNKAFAFGVFMDDDIFAFGISKNGGT